MTVHGLNLLDSAGGWPTGGHVRLWDCGTAWRNIHVAPDHFEWAQLDAMVAANKGANVCFVLAGTPQWAARDPHLPHYAPWVGEGSNSMPWDMKHWQQYVRAVVTRYQGRIKSYQIWNEPQLKDFWGYDSYDVLAEMTRLAFKIIRQIDPAARVIAAPVLPRSSSGGMKRGKKYLSALRGKQWPVDVFAAHIYPEIGEGPARWAWAVKEFRLALRELRAPKRPCWVTETNFNLLGGQLATKTQIEAYMRGVDVAAGEADIFKVFWYAWQHSDPRLLGIRFTPESKGTEVFIQLTKGATRG